MINKFGFCVLICLLFCWALFPSFVLAKYTIDNAQGFLDTANQSAGVEQTDVFTIAARIVQVGLGIVSLVFFILIFYAGYRWLLARGNEEDTKKALNTITASVIGLMIIVGAYALTNFVINRMFGTQTNEAPVQENIPAIQKKVTGPKGCCLDEYEAEGSYWDIGNAHHWLWSVDLDEAVCEEQGLTCANGDQVCGSANWHFMSGVTDLGACEKIAKNYNMGIENESKSDQKKAEGQQQIQATIGNVQTTFCCQKGQMFIDCVSGISTKIKTDTCLSNNDADKIACKDAYSACFKSGGCTDGTCSN